MEKNRIFRRAYLKRVLVASLIGTAISLTVLNLFPGLMRYVIALCLGIGFLVAVVFNFKKKKS